MGTQSLIALPAVLAIEPGIDKAPLPLTLNRNQSAELAALIAADLAALVPQATPSQLVIAGALFDPAELLRPGFPIWTTLEELFRRAPRPHSENIIAFGSYKESMPAHSLEPNPDYAEGPMRLLPLILFIPEELAPPLVEAWETALIGRGEAGMHTADWLIRTLKKPLEHIRYLSRDDLLALTCVQYEHANLAPLWTLLETALLTPYREVNAISPRGLEISYTAGKIIVQPPTLWLKAQSGSAEQLSHHLAGMLFELRQYAALAQAHGLSLSLPNDITNMPAGSLLEPLADPEEILEAPKLFAHEAKGLGVIAVTVAQRVDQQMKVLAHGFPLSPYTLQPLIHELIQRYRCTPGLHKLGCILLNQQHQLSAPMHVLH